MCLDFPELSKDSSFKSNLGLDFVRENLFEEFIQLQNYSKRTEFITSIGDMKQKIGEEEEPYFDKNFLIKRFLGLTMDEYKKNEKYKEQEAKEAEERAKAKEGEGGAEGGEEATFTL